MRYYSSTATAKTLSSAITSSSSQIILNDLTGLPQTFPYTLVLDPDVDGKEEIVLVTSNPSGTTLNVTRGSDTYLGITGGNGTSKVAHDAAAVVKHMVTARDLQEPQDHMAATTGVHGITGSLAPAASPTFTGTVTLPSTTSIGNVSSTELGYLDGVTSGVQAQLDAKATIASPSLTGTPAAPTASSGTNTTQIATTAFVQTEIATKQPLDADLTAIAGLSSNGIIVRSGAGTAAVRSITVGKNLEIANAGGSSGNPLISVTDSLPYMVESGTTSITGSGTVTFTKTFDVAPIVIVSLESGSAGSGTSVSSSSISSTGFTARVWTGTSASTAARTVHWTAIQMTSTTAAG